MFNNYHTNRNLIFSSGLKFSVIFMASLLVKIVISDVSRKINYIDLNLNKSKEFNYINNKTVVFIQTTKSLLFSKDLVFNAQEKNEYQNVRNYYAQLSKRSFESKINNLTESTGILIKTTNSNSFKLNYSVKLEYNYNTDERISFIFMSIFYTVSTLSAIILNLIVILVYLFGRSARTDLSIYLINLAIADFLMSTVCMPFTFAQVLLHEWIFGEIMCPIGNFIFIDMKLLYNFFFFSSFQTNIFCIIKYLYNGRNRFR